jgi:hypothetical protein
MRSLLFIFIVLSCSIALKAQTRNPKECRLFDDSRVHRVDISIDTNKLSEIFKHVFSNSEQEASFVIHYEHDSDTVESVGLRIKGATSRFNPKKSFKIGFNSFVKGQKYQRLEKLNLNANWNDPTQIRTHLAIKLYENAGISVSRSSFTELYINGSYYGLYNMIEQIDDAYVKSRYGSKKGNLYKCLSNADLSYRGDRIKEYTNHEKNPTYQLKTNKKKADYSGLLSFLKLLNQNTGSGHKCQLENRFNMDDYLKVAAVDLLIANWDGYIFNRNNYYLYDNPKTGKFEYIPYDFDNTFGTDWIGEDWGNRNIYDWAFHRDFIFNPDNFENADDEMMEWITPFYESFMADTLRPLYYYIMQTDEYRNQLNYNINLLLESKFNTDSLSGEIDRLFTMLTPALKKDSFDRYSWEEIVSSMDEAIDVEFQIATFKHKFLRYGLREFIEVSHDQILSQLEPAESHMNLVALKVRKQDENLIFGVQINGEVPKNISTYISMDSGPFRQYAMSDDGRGDDQVRSDGIFSVWINKENSKEVRYYFQSELDNGESVREPCSGYLTK